MPNDNPSPPVLRLNNLYAKCPQRSSIAAWVSTPHHDYFIRHVLAGEHGTVQAILSHFWSKFYEYCVTVAKIPEVWNIDGKNSQRLAEILARLNFADISEMYAILQKLNEQEIIIVQLQNELSSLRSQRPGRPNPRVTKPKVKSIPSNGNKRGTRSSRAKVQDASGPTEGNEGKCDKKAEGEASQES